MRRWIAALVAGTGLMNVALAQDFVGGPGLGNPSVGSSEPLYKYDDQEKWKHGWFQEMPYYGGYSMFRPYNYHDVFGQATTAQGWGMSMPYSQQFWNRYEHMTNLAQPAGAPAYGLQPVPYPVQGMPQYPVPHGVMQPGMMGYPPAGMPPGQGWEMQYPAPGTMQQIPARSAPQSFPMEQAPAAAPMGWQGEPAYPRVIPQQNIPTAYEQPVGQQTQFNKQPTAGPSLPLLRR
jgi:hypothetical protein